MPANKRVPVSGVRDVGDGGGRRRRARRSRRGPRRYGVGAASGRRRSGDDTVSIRPAGVGIVYLCGQEIMCLGVWCNGTVQWYGMVVRYGGMVWYGGTSGSVACCICSGVSVGPGKGAVVRLYGGTAGRPRYGAVVRWCSGTVGSTARRRGA